MAGEYLPPVVLKITADIDGLISKLEAAQAKVDEFEADMAAKGAAMKGEQDVGGGGLGSGLGSLPWVSGTGGIQDVDRAAVDADHDVSKLDRTLGFLRQSVEGPLRQGLTDVTNGFQDIGSMAGSAANGVTSFLGSIGGAIGGAAGGIGGAWGNITSAFSNITGFIKQWVIMLPTIVALPALLGAMGGAAGGAAASFTVLASAIGIFAAGAMSALGIVSSVSTMAQFDALSAPLQTLYYALHNFENEWTELTQTIGSTTITDTLTQMLNTGTSLLQRFSPILGQIASAGSAAFQQLDNSLNSSQFATFINWIGTNATPVLTTFTQTFTNVATGWAGLMEALTPAMKLFDDGMVNLTSAFANFATTHESQIQGFIQYVQDAWPQVTAFWSGLGHILYEFFDSAAKGAPALAQSLGTVFTEIGNAIPTIMPFVEQAIPGLVSGFANLLLVITPLIGPVGDLVGGLVDITTSFLGGLFGTSGAPTVKNMSKLLENLGKDAKEAAKGFHKLGEDIHSVLGFIGTLLGPLQVVASFLAALGQSHPTSTTIPTGLGAGNLVNAPAGATNYRIPAGQLGAGAPANTNGGVPPKVEIHSHHTIQVAGPFGNEALAQLQKLFGQHDAELVRALNQVRHS